MDPDPDYPTCCWLAALARAGGFTWRHDYWLMRAAESWRPGAVAPS